MTDQATEAQTSPPQSDTHEKAAATAVEHLEYASQLLGKTYDHPHHRAWIETIQTSLRNVSSQIGKLPEYETNRAEYAARLLKAHNSRTLDTEFGRPLPDHAEQLLTQELERQGH